MNPGALGIMTGPLTYIAGIGVAFLLDKVRVNKQRINSYLSRSQLGEVSEFISQKNGIFLFLSTV